MEEPKTSEQPEDDSATGAGDTGVGDTGAGDATDPAATQVTGEDGGDEATPNADPQTPRKTVGSALGEIAWLLSQSPNHRHSLFLADLEWFAMPALMHNQYRLFYAEGRPIGVAFWAFITETVEARLAAGGRIGADDWRAGDRVWLTEIVAPYGNQQAMLDDLCRTALADRKFRFIRTQPNGRRETVELNGVNIG